MILGWSHGRKYQGGTGAYRTDGPVMPDLIYATTSTINSLGRRERGRGPRITRHRAGVPRGCTIPPDCGLVTARGVAPVTRARKRTQIESEDRWMVDNHTKFPGNDSSVPIDTAGEATIGGSPLRTPTHFTIFVSNCSPSPTLNKTPVTRP